MKKNKTLWCILVCFILLLLVFSLVTYKTDTDTILTCNIDSEKFAFLQKSGYSVSQNKKNGITTYTTTNNDPWTHIPMPEKINADFIIIDFATPITEETQIVIYYSPDGGPFDASHVYSHSYLLDYSKTIATVFVDDMECNAVRLDMGGTFAINSIKFYDVQVNSPCKYSINLKALILLTVLITLLIVFEKRIGFFSWVKSITIKEYQHIRSFVGDSNFLAAVVHLLTLLSSLSLLAAISTVFFKSTISTAQVTIIFILSCVTIIFIVLDRLFIGKSSSAAGMFFVISLLLGVMFTFCLPITTLNVPDEEIHYSRVVELKNFLFAGHTSFADFKMGWRVYNNFAFLDNPLRESLILSEDHSILFKIGSDNINLYNSLGYLPAAISKAFSDLLSLSYIQSFLLMKLTNLAVYSSIIAMALKRLTSGAYMISAISLMPFSIMLACSFSYDGWVLSFITYGVVYFISELQRPNKKLKASDCILMVGSLFIGCGPKAIYFLLLTPLLFISKNKFKTKKQHSVYLITCLSTMTIILFSFALPFFMDTGGASDLRGGTDVNATEQLKFICQNPFQYAKILFDFTSDYLSLGNMSNNIITHTFLGTPRIIYATVMIFIIMFSTFTDKSEFDLFDNRYVIRGVALLSSAGTLIFVITALYIAFTPVAHNTVNGVQFRYIFPIMPMFFYSLGSARVRSNIDKRITQTLVFGVSAIVSMCSIYEFSISKFIS